MERIEFSRVDGVASTRVVRQTPSRAIPGRRAGVGRQIGYTGIRFDPGWGWIIIVWVRRAWIFPVGMGNGLSLPKQVDSSLQGILYVFDEPSIGLSPAYQEHLYGILRRLISRGNTVMVVEHDLNLIQQADWIVELGPKAGIHGGEVIYNGKGTDFLLAEGLESPTLVELRSFAHDLNKERQELSVTDFYPAAKRLSVVSRKTAAILDRIKAYSEEKSTAISSRIRSTDRENAP